MEYFDPTTELVEVKQSEPTEARTLRVSWVSMCPFYVKFMVQQPGGVKLSLKDLLFLDWATAVHRRIQDQLGLPSKEQELTYQLKDGWIIKGHPDGIKDGWVYEVKTRGAFVYAEMEEWWKYQLGIYAILLQPMNLKGGKLVVANRDTGAMKGYIFSYDELVKFGEEGLRVLAGIKNVLEDNYTEEAEAQIEEEFKSKCSSCPFRELCHPDKKPEAFSEYRPNVPADIATIIEFIDVKKALKELKKKEEELKGKLNLPIGKFRIGSDRIVVFKGTRTDIDKERLVKETGIDLKKYEVRREYVATRVL